MTIPPPGLELRPLTIPSSIEDADAADFIEMTRVRNRVYAQISGHDDHRIAPDELLPHYAPDPHADRHLWIVVLDGALVGRAGVDLPLEEGSRVAFWQIELLREVWGRGIGTVAYELIERTARARGRSILQSSTEHPAAEGPRLVPPTGFGSIPEDHAARFYLRHGYTLEQIDRVSSLPLPGSEDHLRRLLEGATAAAAGYRVVQWQLPTPEEFVEGYALMKSRMASDAPSAGLVIDQPEWDAARLARHERTYLDAGRPMLVTAAQHIDSGDLVAFNELTIGKDRTEATHQEDTLVLAEHRGHRLGMLVKCAGLLAWRDVAPQSPRVLTYNAEENRPMLGINEQIGFAPLAYEGAWKKVLNV